MSAETSDFAPSAAGAVEPPSPERLRIRVEGIVQGVGFRPFVYNLARDLGLTGSVLNDSRGVLIEAQGRSADLARFREKLASDAPPLAVVEAVREEAIDPRAAEAAFEIAESTAGEERATLVSPDTATCDDCLRELFDPSDRRFGYPFLNCTNCGPRFTIVRDVPYDRPATTMAAFPMCADCEREYRDPSDRRFHAQPVACAACGPRAVYREDGREAAGDDAIDAAAAAIRSGGIVAVKGLGGYHLAADAASERAVSRLRARKRREEKPFAILAPDLESARMLVHMTEADEAALAGPRRPIVLLPRRDGGRVASSVAPGNRSLGVLLPYTPLHHLLARRVGRPIVLTSGNASDEPIAYRDDDAGERLAEIADGFLVHDREIHVRADDSVVRAFREAPIPIRRSRGYAPSPVALPVDVSVPILACGAELKNTICVARGRRAFLSHHIGDLENPEALASFEQAIAHYRRLFDVSPGRIAYDLHPEYLSTKWAREQEGVELRGVQHHHAHVASCLADNGRTEPAIGIAFDGLGFGTDGALWGGEFLAADLTGFERLGHLAYVAMPGGAAAIREPWRMAAVHLDQAFGSALPFLAVRERHRERWDGVLHLARAGGATAPETSSAGRLFDAVAALLGVRDTISYEGQAAVELEQLADVTEAEAYEAAFFDHGDEFEIRASDLVRCAAEDLDRGVDRSRIAARFHNGVADAILAGARAARERTGLSAAALSGGVFQNVLLLERASDRLERDGFTVLRHRQVPPNDGGISLGQAVVAGTEGPSDALASLLRTREAEDA